MVVCPVVCYGLSAGTGVSYATTEIKGLELVGYRDTEVVLPAVRYCLWCLLSSGTAVVSGADFGAGGTADHQTSHSLLEGLSWFLLLLGLLIQDKLCCLLCLCCGIDHQGPIVLQGF